MKCRPRICRQGQLEYGTPAYRAAVGVALGTMFLLVWGNFVQGADGVNPAAFGYFVVVSESRA